MTQVLYALTDAEHATVLAALRAYQAQLNLPLPINLREIATNYGTIEPLDAKQIDQLCESLNHSGLDVGQTAQIIGSDSNDPYVAYLQGRQRDGEMEVDQHTFVSKGSDSGAYVMAWIWVGDDDVAAAAEEEDAPARAGDAITDAMLDAAAQIDDLDEAVRSVMDQVGITTGDVAGLHFSGTQDRSWWPTASISDRLEMLQGWRAAEQTWGDLAPEVKP
jgi:hypothetical protein